jgi:hypothetical protein
MTIAALLALVALVAGCAGSTKGNHTRASTGSSRALMAQFLAYSGCMRSHGVSNFPDPTTSGGIGIVLPKSLDLNAPAFKAADQACRTLAPAGHPTTPSVSPQKFAAELRLARCVRSHGRPGFPDPNSQGVFDRSRLDKSSPAFKAAGRACASLVAAVGSLPAG